VELDYPDKEGSTLRQRLLNAERQAKRNGFPVIQGKQHQVIVPPRAGQIVWEAFWSLDEARQSHGYGPQRLSNEEIYAWTQLYQQRLQLWEINALRAMDRAYLNAVAKKSDEE